MLQSFRHLQHRHILCSPSKCVHPQDGSGTISLYAHVQWGWDYWAIMLILCFSLNVQRLSAAPFGLKDFFFKGLTVLCAMLPIPQFHFNYVCTPKQK